MEEEPHIESAKTAEPRRPLGRFLPNPNTARPGTRSRAGWEGGTVYGASDAGRDFRLTDVHGHVVEEIMV